MRQLAWGLLFGCLLFGGGAVGAVLTANDPVFVGCAIGYAVCMLGAMLVLVAAALGVVK